MSHVSDLLTPEMKLFKAYSLALAILAFLPSHTWEAAAATVICQDAITSGDKVFCSGREPLQIVVKDLQKGQVVSLTSTRCPDSLNASKSAQDGRVEFVLDYRLKKLDAADSITVKVEKTDVVALRVFPIRATVSGQTDKDEGVWWECVGMEAPISDPLGKSTLDYKIQPWDDELAQYISFITTPPLFAEARLKLSCLHPTAKEGQLEATAETNDPAAITLIPMLSYGDVWKECGPRLLVQLMFMTKKAKSRACTPDECTAIDKAIAEVYPEPLDATSRQSVEKLKESLHANYIPHLPAGLKLMSENFRKQLLLFFNGTPEGDLCLALASYTVQCAPPPEKPLQDSKKP